MRVNNYKMYIGIYKWKINSSSYSQKEKKNIEWIVLLDYEMNRHVRATHSRKEISCNINPNLYTVLINIILLSNITKGYKEAYMRRLQIFLFCVTYDRALHIPYFITNIFFDIQGYKTLPATVMHLSPQHRSKVLKEMEDTTCALYLVY